MLSFLWPVRVVGALFAITLVFAVWPRGEPERDWQVGRMIRGSLCSDGDRHTFSVARSIGSRCADEVIEVHYQGELSETVCGNMDVYVTGEQTGHQTFTASRVVGFNDGRYDHCWRLRCQPERYQACRGSNNFE